MFFSRFHNMVGIIFCVQRGTPSRMGRRYLIRGLFMIFQDSGYGAVQNKAQFIKRFCRDGLPAFHAVNRIRRQPMTINEVIGGHILFVQRAPKRLIGNHTVNPLIIICIMILIETCEKPCPPLWGREVRESSGLPGRGTAKRWVRSSSTAYDLNTFTMF